MAKLAITADVPTFRQIPDPILDAIRDRKLPLNAIGYYAMLDSYRNRTSGLCNPSLLTLSGDTGLSIPTLRKLNGLLVAAKFMRIVSPANPSQSQRYILMYSPEWPVHDDVDACVKNLHAPTGSREASCAKSCATSRATASCTEQDEPNEPDKQEKKTAKPPQHGWPKRGTAKDKPINPHEFLEDWFQWYKDKFRVCPNWTRNQWAQYNGQFGKAIGLYGANRLFAMMDSYWHVGEKKDYQITVDGFFRQQDALYQRTKVRE